MSGADTIVQLTEGAARRVPMSAGTLPQNPTSAEPLPFQWASKVTAVLETDDLIQSLLGSVGLSVLYGESNVGKSFLAIDMAFHIAMGLPWFERRTKRAAVLYLILEGGNSFRNRVVALRAKHAVTTHIPLAIVSISVDLMDPHADTQKVVATIRLIQDTEPDYPLGLVIVDTLSRAMAGGNENSPEDMGTLVKNADLIRQETGVHLMFVHHTGKDLARGARGHSLLRAATDTELEISGAETPDGKVSIITTTKQRDLSFSDPFSFRLEPYELGTNQWGEPVTSCTVSQVETPEAMPKNKKLPAAQRIALDALTDTLARHGQGAPYRDDHFPVGVTVVSEDAWREAAYARSISDGTPDAKQKAFRRASQALIAGGQVGAYSGLVWVVS